MFFFEKKGCASTALSFSGKSAHRLRRDLRRFGLGRGLGDHRLRRHDGRFGSLGSLRLLSVLLQRIHSGDVAALLSRLLQRMAGEERIEHAGSLVVILLIHAVQRHDVEEIQRVQREDDHQQEQDHAEQTLEEADQRAAEAALLVVVIVIIVVVLIVVVIFVVPVLILVVLVIAGRAGLAGRMVAAGLAGRGLLVLIVFVILFVVFVLVSIPGARIAVEGEAAVRLGKRRRTPDQIWTARRGGTGA